MRRPKRSQEGAGADTANETGATRLDGESETVLPNPPDDADGAPSAASAPSAPTAAPETSTSDTVAPKDPGTGVMWSAIALVVLAAAFVVVAVQNTDQVDVRFLWLEVSTPLVVVMAVAAAITLVVAEVVGFVWRRRRRTHRRERVELRQLRSQG